MGNQCFKLKPGYLRPSLGKPEEAWLPPCGAKAGKIPDGDFWLNCLQRSHGSPSLAGTLQPITLTTILHSPVSPWKKRDSKLQGTQFEIYISLIKLLNAVQKGIKHTPLQGNSMNCFFFFFFLNKFVQKENKNKNPRITPIPYSHPVRYAGCDGSWDGQR